MLHIAGYLQIGGSRLQNPQIAIDVILCPTISISILIINDENRVCMYNSYKLVDFEWFDVLVN